jgi:DNA-3-methyladenine glycosylase II
MQKAQLLEIPLPSIFNQKLLFQYLNRSPNEITFDVQSENVIYKLFDFQDELILTKLIFTTSQIQIESLNKKPRPSQIEKIKLYVKSWFDLETDLNEFYQMASKDAILKSVIKNLPGLRIVKSPDFFEAISWSIIGQQINLPFAYSCKKALVEKVGKRLVHENKTYYSFPRPIDVLRISDSEFREMKFSGQKARYIRGVAEEMISGSISLTNLSFEEAKTRLIALKGIGNWSANYVLMRCLGFKEAFPLEDVGLHNALKKQLVLEAKPSLDEIKIFAQNWKGWEAYATFYLWQTLLNI